MATQHKKGQHDKTTKTLSEMRTHSAPQGIDNIIPVKARTPLAIILIALSLLVFFGKVLSSEKTFNAGDNIASESILPYLNAAQAAGQAVPQWIPNIFCGMPSYASLLSTGDRTYDVLYHSFNIIRNGAKALGGGSDGMFMLFHYFIFGLGMYLFLRLTRNTSHLVSLFGAVAAMFSTWILTYAMIGHNTKVFSIMCFPYILLCLEKLRSGELKWYTMLMWSTLLGVAIHFLLEATHVQMTFYMMLTVAIYFVTWLVSDIFSKKNLMPVLRVGLITVLMAGLAFAMSADRYMATLSYDPYSIRGASPLVERQKDGDATNKLSDVNKKAGLDWEYATSYSFSPSEMVTFIIPGWYGFGKLPYSGPEVGGQETSVPTYWGQSLGTDAANYTGIIVFFLALIGIFALWKKDRLIAPLALTSLFGLLLSFGSTMPLLYRPMFEFFPVFNKFRAPMMALIMMQLSFPIIAALTLEKILTIGGNTDEKALKKRLTKYSTYAMYTTAGLFVIFLAGRSALESTLRSGLAASGKQVAQYPDGIKDLAISAGLNDAVVCMLIASIAFALLSFYLKGKKLSPSLIVVGILILTFVDQWRVGARPFETTTKSDQQQAFREHDYVNFIKQDKSLYRILDLNEPTSNVPASWMTQTIAGYHAAKVRRFQDLVDVTGNSGGGVIFNPFIWSLLNTKYIIANGAIDSVQGRMSPAFISKEPQQGRDGKPVQTIVWQNNAVLPRAFFVNRYEIKQPLPMLEAMRDGKYDPRDVIFFDEQPKDIGSPASTPIDVSETINITKYENEHIEMKTKTSAERLVFFSDTWYPNWQLTIDGKPTSFYRADYAFRAFKVPAGDHSVVWEYHDQAYETGRGISLGANIIALIGLVIGIGMSVRKKPEEISAEEETSVS